jgi:MFS family permease
MLLPSLGTSIANVALPTLETAFSAPINHVHWVVLSYLLSVTTLIVGVGRLGDLVGRRWLLLWGVALFALASFCAAVLCFALQRRHSVTGGTDFA